ncbi:phage integrase family protein [Herbaspirillum sp. CF444]|uniref:site-specific integrase n=1 Tax=Herbaspirillum sp. CF444 TaxID=1144319 RepID=UPI0002726E75|nr:site-specific integrase [Herbaspirillum sp. CF444]EJL88527.1 phage integrase family protein [Herbaspirillum sp. CF444]
MRKIYGSRNAYLLHDDGTIHYPFSKFLTNEHNNAHSVDSASQALRIFYRFCSVHNIELAARAVEGRCLTLDEIARLIGLCFRPLPEIELASDSKIVSLTSARAGKRPEKMPHAVSPNTAKTRLWYIAHYIHFYHDVFLAPNLIAPDLRANTRHEFNAAAHRIKRAIRGSKQGHHHDIQSLPINKFMEIIRAIFVWPEEFFLTKSGRLSRTILRDRAIALLACECLRPGAIGNILRSDFDFKGNRLRVEDHRDRRDFVSSSTPVLKLGDSTKVNSASETTITLWPFTAFAIQEYLDTERNDIQLKRLNNNSRGFLFLSQNGSPIKHRSVITTLFSELGERLKLRGLLDATDDRTLWKRRHYHFNAYVLRHSAASFFLESKGTDESVLDMMRIRFGWTAGSTQPLRYAARALSDQANIDLVNFSEELFKGVESRSKK